MSVRFVFVTMDGGHNAALRQAALQIKQAHGIDVQLALHAAPALRDAATWQRLEQDMLQADFIFGCMIFGEEFVRPMQEILAKATAPICFITSNPALIYATRLGKLSLAQKSEEDQGLVSRWMQKLRPKKNGRAEGHRQTAMLTNLTKLMKYVPGKVRDLHTFIAVHDFWLHSSPDNLARMILMFLDRYVPAYQGTLPFQEAIKYPDAAVYHPDAPAPFESNAAYRAWRQQQGRPIGANGPWKGAAGLLIHRAVVLSGNTAHLDALIRHLEAQGIEARTTYSALLDFRPSIDQFMTGQDDLPHVDVLLNCMGFPLVGGPAGTRPDEASAALHTLDVGYFDMVPLTFQHVDHWRQSDVGLLPMQTAMNIALPELDGGVEPVLFGGPVAGRDKFIPLEPELPNAARRIARRVRLRHKTNADKKLAVVLFNFPPNLGNAGTAMYLDVFNSLYRMLTELRDAGYRVDLPPDADTLRQQVVEGNALQYGTDGNVAAHLSLDDYRRLFPHHVEIEPYWGYAPGELLTDGKRFHILGAQFGSVFVGIQPSFGYERDPMRLLMGKDAAPHHGFAAFYTWLDQVYDADAVVHFGTHGALEFMPGKQNGVCANCWPHRLLGSLPNFYYYCVNNPSEGSIARRRGAATLVSYMVPPLQQAGLYKGLRRLKDSIENYHKRPSPELLTDIRTQAEKLGILVEPPAHDATNGHAPTDQPTRDHATNGHATNGHPTNGHGPKDHPTNDHLTASAYLAALGHELIQVEHRMIPLGLHVLGQAPGDAELVDM
ncbi:MAG: cobaltochelatase subunit CobN, partial [Anaerolineales bacterium]|nr:cobaltochelatase subunit CobN [Anaerolineales bacterium]